MPHTLRQVRPLLNQDELELFQSSRATPIRALAERQLASRIRRSRLLRDKYRDLYRRQTVQGRGRADAADANRRTQMKAEILAAVLERYEAEQARREALAASATASATAGKPAAKKTAVKKPAVKKTVATKAPAGKTAPARKAPASKKAPAKKAVASKPAAPKPAAAAGPAKRRQAAVAGSVSATVRGAVPTGVTPKALRTNPLKAKPVNKKIHASARGRQKVFAAKRAAR